MTEAPKSTKSDFSIADFSDKFLYGSVLNSLRWPLLTPVALVPLASIITGKDFAANANTYFTMFSIFVGSAWGGMKLFDRVDSYNQTVNVRITDIGQQLFLNNMRRIQHTVLAPAAIAGATIAVTSALVENNLGFLSSGDFSTMDAFAHAATWTHSTVGVIGNMFEAAYTGLGNAVVSSDNGVSQFFEQVLYPQREDGEVLAMPSLFDVGSTTHWVDTEEARQQTGSVFLGSLLSVPFVRGYMGAIRNAEYAKATLE
jgi:hypothetical protein